MTGHMLRRVVSSLVTLFVFVSLLFFLAHNRHPREGVGQAGCHRPSCGQLLRPRLQK
jgi:hypothetical protein